MAIDIKVERGHCPTKIVVSVVDGPATIWQRSDCITQEDYLLHLAAKQKAKAEKRP